MIEFYITIYFFKILFIFRDKWGGREKEWETNTSVQKWCWSRPAGSMCWGCNGQIHTDSRNPVEKKGWHGHSLRERERERARERACQRARPLPGRAFIAFLGTLHRGWSSFTMNRFSVGDYLLQITKERMLLITSKRRVLRIKDKSGWTVYTPYLGGLAQTLGS